MQRDRNNLSSLEWYTYLPTSFKILSILCEAEPIYNAMKTPRSVRENTEYQSSVSLPYIGSASHKIERILKEVGTQVYHSSEDKLFRSLCTHEDRVNEFQKPGVWPEPGRNLHYVLKNIRLIARKPNSKNQPWLNTRGLKTIA